MGREPGSSSTETAADDLQDCLHDCPSAPRSCERGVGPGPPPENLRAETWWRVRVPPSVQPSRHVGEFYEIFFATSEEWHTSGWSRLPLRPKAQLSTAGFAVFKRPIHPTYVILKLGTFEFDSVEVSTGTFGEADLLGSSRGVQTTQLREATRLRINATRNEIAERAEDAAAKQRQLLRPIGC